jgi:hypothetical protein
MNKYDYILCELYYPYIHGITDDSANNIDTHFLVIGKYDYKTGFEIDDYGEYDTDVEYDTDTDNDSFENNIPKMNDFISIHSNVYKHYLQANLLQSNPHPSIRNYTNIVSKYNYIKPEIGQCFQLNTGETIAILKTIWIKIIQRRWKKVFNIRKQLIAKRQFESYLYEIGKKKFVLPGLKGLLYNI